MPQQRRKAERYKEDVDAAPISAYGTFSVAQTPCICLQFSKSEDEQPGDEQKAQREEICGKLRAIGLLVTTSESRDKDEAFIKVSAPLHVLRFEAEEMKLKLKMKDDHGGGLCAYQRKYENLFDVGREGTLFSSLHQLRIIEQLITKPHNEGGAALDFDGLKLGGSGFEAQFWMHYEPAREFLKKTWMQAWQLPQPIEYIKDYYGEKVGLYFTWLGFYTTSLWVPAIVGILMTVTQVLSYTKTGSMDNPWVPLYCVFICVWATLFLEQWKRLQCRKQYEWDTRNFEEEEHERPQFVDAANPLITDAEYKERHGMSKPGVELVEDPVTKQEERVYPDLLKYLKLSVTTSIVIGFISTVVVVVAYVFVLKHLIKQKFRDLGPIAAAMGGVTCAMTIMIFDKIYGKVVPKLVDWEVWRTETEYEDALIAKSFCFQFINKYFSLFFIAFVQNYTSVFGYEMPCPDYHCMPVLSMQLLTVFGTQMFVQQSMEIGMPHLKAWLRHWKEEREMKKKLKEMGEDAVPIMELTPEEEQAKMEEFEGVFDDYQEMVQQFGYVTLFAAAFPLTSLLALINNVIEIRVDAAKLVTATKRPAYLCAQDIGTWYSILDILVTGSIMTNAALIGFTSHGLFLYFGIMSWPQRIWAVILFEHAVLMFKLILEAVVPDEPGDVLREHNRREFLKDQAIRFHKLVAAPQMEDSDMPWQTSDDDAAVGAAP